VLLSRFSRFSRFSLMTHDSRAAVGTIAHRACRHAGVSRPAGDTAPAGRHAIRQNVSTAHIPARAGCCFLAEAMMTIRVERSGPVTTVIMDRPEVRNAVDGPTAAALADAFVAFDADPDAAVAVLYGAGGTFCAGADLRAVGTADGNRTQPEGNGPMGPTRMRLSKPVIAAVAGHAVAGGLELALWCDLRVAEEDAIFGVFCRRWGVPLIDGGTVRLPRLIGLGRALDLIMTGRAVDADEAMRIGLVSRLVPHGGAREAAERLAAELAALPQACLRHDRLSALESVWTDHDAAMAGEFAHGMASLADPALIAGVTRFRQGAGRGGAPA
jgi:enoyl-CoA hydratase